MAVTVETSSKSAIAEGTASILSDAPVVKPSSKDAEGVLAGPAVTVLPQDLAEAHYEAVKQIVDNLKPSEKELKLRAERQKEVREDEDAEALREKEGLEHDLEQARLDAQNHA